MNQSIPFQVPRRPGLHSEAHNTRPAAAILKKINPYPDIRIFIPETWDKSAIALFDGLRRQQRLGAVIWITNMDDTVAEAPVTEPQSWAEGRSSPSLYEQLVSPSSLNMEGVSKELLKASGK